MSRQIRMNNYQTKSISRNFTNDDNSDSSLDLTELQAQNSQLHINNSNKTEVISQISKENNEIKKKYEELLHAFSNQHNNSTNSYSNQTPNVNTTNSTHFFENMTQSFLPDERAEREVQLWTEMWTHIVSMISNIIPYSRAEPRTANERRAILVDLISRLCQLANDNTNTQYSALLKKYQKTKEKLKYFQKQNSKLASEVTNYKQLLDQKHITETENDEAVLSQKIKTLEGLLHKLIDKQRQLQINSTIFSLKPSAETVSYFTSRPDQNLILQQQKEQKNQLKHRVIQFDESEESYSTDDAELYNNNKSSSNNYNLQITPSANNCNKSKANNIFSKTRYTTSQNNQVLENNSNKNNMKRKIPQSLSKRLGIDEISGISSSIEIKKSHSKKSKKKLSKLKDEDEVDFIYSNKSSDDDQDDTNSDFDSEDYHHQLISAEAEADEILAKSLKKRRNNDKNKESNYNYEYQQKIKRKTCSNSNRNENKASIKKSKGLNEDGNEIRKKYRDHLNQLVNLANHLTDDYHRLGKYFGNESNGTEFSIDHLSKLHDSLIDIEKTFNDASG